MSGVQDNSDGVPPIYVRDSTVDAVSRANLAKLSLPQRRWIVPTKCGVMDCDGPKSVMIHDLDGSLTGQGVDSSILARSEYMNERRANGQETWYNIPTKMLYDPCPLNNPSHPGWQTEHLHSLLAGAGGVFTYRRRLQEQDDAKRAAIAAALEAPLEAPLVNATLSAGGRQLQASQSLPASMVFYTGDERALFAHLPAACESTSALYDPACRTNRQTHAEVAYRGYGVYRGEPGNTCTLNTHFNAWVCPGSVMKPMRLIVENLDECVLRPPTPAMDPDCSCLLALLTQRSSLSSAGTARLACSCQWRSRVAAM